MKCCWNLGLKANFHSCLGPSGLIWLDQGVHVMIIHIDCLEDGFEVPFIVIYPVSANFEIVLP